MSSRPGQEGPSFGPPPLPEGWIAQWDGMGRKYYFVQLSTGDSQWETPTHAAPTGPTPQATPQGAEHPYGAPAPQDGERGLGVGYKLVAGRYMLTMLVDVCDAAVAWVGKVAEPEPGKWKWKWAGEPGGAVFE